MFLTHFIFISIYYLSPSPCPFQVDFKTAHEWPLCITVKLCSHAHTFIYCKLFFSLFLFVFVLLSQLTVRMILGVKGKYVTLNPDIETQRDDLFLWMFGDENNLIAQLTGETKETTYTDADERFGDGLRLDKNTGSLTIKNITAGPYKLRIVSSRRNLNRKFRVFICCESFSLTSKCFLPAVD